MLIKVRRVAPAAIARMQVEDIAFPNIDEKTDRPTTSGHTSQRRDSAVEKR